MDTDAYEAAYKALLLRFSNCWIEEKQNCVFDGWVYHLSQIEVGMFISDLIKFYTEDKRQYIQTILPRDFVPSLNTLVTFAHSYKTKHTHTHTHTYIYINIKNTF